MGNKVFSVGTLSFKEGKSLTKFPIVEDVREVFLLYHMNIIPRAITHMPMDTKKAKISVKDRKNWDLIIDCKVAVNSDLSLNINTGKICFTSITHIHNLQGRFNCYYVGLNNTSDL